MKFFIWITESHFLRTEIISWGPVTSCFILNRLFSAFKKLKIKHLILSICLKRCLSEVDTLLLYFCLLCFYEKFSASITGKADFLHLILHCHIYVWSYINMIATLLLIAELWLWVIMCYVKQKKTQLNISFIMFELYFQFYIFNWNVTFLGEIKMTFVEIIKYKDIHHFSKGMMLWKFVQTQNSKT